MTLDRAVPLTDPKGDRPRDMTRATSRLDAIWTATPSLRGTPARGWVSGANSQRAGTGTNKFYSYPSREAAFRPVSPSLPIRHRNKPANRLWKTGAAPCSQTAAKCRMCTKALGASTVLLFRATTARNNYRSFPPRLQHARCEFSMAHCCPPQRQLVGGAPSGRNPVPAGS